MLFDFHRIPFEDQGNELHMAGRPLRESFTHLFPVGSAWSNVSLTERDHT